MKAKVLLLIVLLAFSPFCRVKEQPDQVWDIRGKMAALAESLTGLPYRLGGQDIDGFDCSGFCFYVYRCFGIDLPRTAGEQAKLKGKVKLKKARAGDILAFKVKGKLHTAIFLAGDCFVHAPGRGSPVRKECLNSFWRSCLKGVISLLGDKD